MTTSEQQAESLLNLNSPTRWYHKLGTWVLIKYLPARAKRLVFLACVFAYVTDMDMPSDETIHKLNKVLNLSHDDDAIKFPVMIRHVIWKSLDQPIILEDGREVKTFKDIIQTKEDQMFDQVVRILIDRAPAWTKYGSDKVVFNDLQLMTDKLAI